MDIIVAGGGGSKEEESYPLPLPRKKREKEGGENVAAPTKRGEKEAKRERESGVVEAEGCIHPYPSRGGYWGFDYLF